METKEVNGIKTEKSVGELTVSRVYASQYQDDKSMTAELKQVVNSKSFYPEKSVSSNMQDNIFSTEEFGYTQKAFENVETRVAWIDVPRAATQESVQQKLNTLTGACLYRVLSNKPIITDKQKAAIISNEMNLTEDMLADRQVVRYPANHEFAGEIALDKNGKVQYRSVFFSAKARQDEDWRTEDPADYYASPKIVEELSGNDDHTIPGQELPQ